jgi:hypothetical protein
MAAPTPDFTRTDGGTTAPDVTDTRDCIRCGGPAEDGPLYTSGPHCWPCSDEVRDEYLCGF